MMCALLQHPVNFKQHPDWKMLVERHEKASQDQLHVKTHVDVLRKSQNLQQGGPLLVVNGIRMD